MSSDFDIVCDRCRVTMHFGTRFSCGFTMGHGRNDTDGQKRAWHFINEHVGHSVRIVNESPDGYREVDNEADADDLPMLSGEGGEKGQ